MKSYSLLLASLTAIMPLAGCEQKQTGSSSTPTKSSTPAAHTHADGSSHAAHDGPEPEPAAEATHPHGGDVAALGSEKVLDFTVTAKQEGALAAGQEAVFLIDTVPATEAVRLWIGDEKATNAVRTKAEGGPSSYHAHTPVPSPLAPSAQLWVEVQNAAGDRGAVAFDLGIAATATESHSHGEESHSHAGESAHEHAPAPTPTATPRPSTHSHGGGSAHSH